MIPVERRPDERRADLEAAALVMAELGAAIDEWPPDDLGAIALQYALAGWEVFPLRGKVPWIAKEDGGNGVLDATTDLMQVAAWWTRYPKANIGGRVPAGVVVVDIDPGGHEAWQVLIDKHGDVITRTAWSGRVDAEGRLGRHVYFRHPGGKVRGSVAANVDVKTHSGYTVLPPSIHPDTGRPYRWDDPSTPITTPPPWLAHLLRQAPTAPPPRRRSPTTYEGNSIADWYSETRTWAEVLEPHGWHLVSGNGDEDDSRWKHPTATHSWSATVRHGCLFVYSPNTVFKQTGADDRHGYTRFRAFALLDHRDDLSAAARVARQLRGVAA